MPYKRALLAIFLAVSCAHRPPQTLESSSAVTRRSTVLMTTNTAGTQVVTARGNEVVVDYEFNDRGRGPKTHQVIRVDERGIPLSMTITGNDYMKQPVDESFSIANGTASWKNSAEKGDAPAGAFYPSMYGAPEEYGLLAKALLRNGGRLAVYPGGEATIRKVGEETLRGVHVTAYEIGGLSFTPFEIWLDDNNDFFASASSWSSTIREGFEAEAKQLIEAQNARDAARKLALAKRFAHRPTADRLSIVNARIFDPRTGTVSLPTIINIEGNRIVSIGSPMERNAADVIDAAGRVVLPGLWDMHTHLVDTDGLLDIANGITSVRDLGNDPDDLLDLKAKIEKGEAIGPRVVLAGLIDGPGPFQGPTSQLAGNEEDAKKWIDYFADRGYEGIKIYSSIKPELVPFMARHAHARGMRVSGHIPAGMTASQAVDAGYDEIQHINMLLLNFMPDVTDTRTPARFIEPAKRTADLDLQSPEVQAFIAKLKAHGTVVDPTLTVFEGLFVSRLGEISPTYAAVADRFPPQQRRFQLTGGLPVPEGMDQRYRASFRRAQELVRELHRAGVPIVAGTDGLAGFTLHRELELYVDAGIPAPEVLSIATLRPAQILHREKDLGTIEPGKLADLVIVDGDPTRNISDVRKVHTVVKDGKVYRPSEMLRELGIADR